MDSSLPGRVGAPLNAVPPLASGLARPGKGAAWPFAGGRAGRVLLLCLLNAGMVALLAVGALSGYALTTSVAASLLLGLSVLVWASLSPLTFFSPPALLQTSAFVYVAPLALNRWTRGVLTLEREEVIAFAPVDEAIWLALLAAAAFCLAATPWAVAGEEPRPAPARRRVGGTAIVVIACLLLGSVCLALLIRHLGGLEQIATLGYADRYLAMRGMGPLRVGVDLIFVGGVIYYASQGRRPGAAWRRLLIVALMLGVFGFLFVVEQRRMALFQLLFAFLVLRHALVRRFSSSVLALLGLAIVSVGLVQGLVRGLAERNWGELGALPGYSFNLANTEFGYPTLTIADILARVPDHSDWLGGSSYLDSIAILVPSALWPGRPQPLGEYYVSRFYPEYWERGGGFGFSPVAEAFWNGGIVLVVGVFALLGAVAAAGDRLLVARLAARPSLGMAYALLAPFLLMFYRFDSASFLKGALYLIVPLLLALGTARGLDRAARALAPAPGSG